MRSDSGLFHALGKRALERARGFESHPHRQLGSQPRRRSKTSPPRKKVFFTFFNLRSLDFFFQKEKKTFLRGSALNEQGGGASARARRNPPQTPRPPAAPHRLWRRSDPFGLDAFKFFVPLLAELRGNT